jgi:hypothetical protein
MCHLDTLIVDSGGVLFSLQVGPLHLLLLLRKSGSA